MRYCSLPDLELAIPRLTLIQLSNDTVAEYGQPDPTLNQPVLEAAVNQAEELVDAHLRGRYTLPLEPVPTVVKDITVNLARHWLYVRRPEGSDLPDAVARTYKSALQMLEAIRDGKLSIGAPSGESTPEPGEMKMRTQSRHFNTDLMARFC